MTRVLIVDDSAVGVEVLSHVLAKDPEITVLAVVGDGHEALEILNRLHPDVIIMDVHLPRMNGFDATRKIMEQRPIPIVMVSGTVDTTDPAVALRAMEAGALALLARPTVNGPTSRTEGDELVRTVKLMSEVKLVRRWQRRDSPPPLRVAPLPVATPDESTRSLRLVAVGVSTGGPLALKALLSALPGDFPLPITIVQHIAPGFVGGFAEWLGRDTGFPVQVAADHQRLQAGHAYIAPDDVHMGVDVQPAAVFSRAPPEHGLRPSVSYLFRSVAQTLGAQAVGILLTGMGKDGAQEMKRLRDRGAITFAQDQSSCVVFGMPEEAIRLGAATHVLPPGEIGNALVKLALTGSCNYERH